MLNLILFSVLSVTQIDVFEGKLVYDNPFADTRSPESGLSLKSSRYRGADLKYLDAVIGRTILVIRLRNRNDTQNFDLQLGLEAATWTVLGYDDGRFPLITQDFLIAVPLMFRFDSVSGALKFNHLSAHVGDGFDLLWDKTLTNEQKQKIRIVEQQEDVSVFPAIRSYSRDFLSLDIAKDIVRDRTKLKLYAKVAYVHKMIPRYLKRWSGGGGLELRYFNFYLAQNLVYYQDVNNFTLSAQAGWLFEGKTVQSRIFLAGVSGSDRRGQFVGRSMNELSLGFGVR